MEWNDKIITNLSLISGEFITNLLINFILKEFGTNTSEPSRIITPVTKQAVKFIASNTTINLTCVHSLVIKTCN